MDVLDALRRTKTIRYGRDYGDHPFPNLGETLDFVKVSQVKRE